MEGSTIKLIEKATRRGLSMGSAGVIQGVGGGGPGARRGDDARGRRGWCKGSAGVVVHGVGGVGERGRLGGGAVQGVRRGRSVVDGGRPRVGWGRLKGWRRRSNVWRLL